MEDEIGEISLDRYRVLLAKFYAARNEEAAIILIGKIDMVYVGLIEVDKDSASAALVKILEKLDVGRGYTLDADRLALDRKKINLLWDGAAPKKNDGRSELSAGLATTALGCAAAIGALGIITALATKQAPHSQPAQVAH